jgi:hypothetical protein
MPAETPRDPFLREKIMFSIHDPFLQESVMVPDSTILSSR